MPVPCSYGAEPLCDSFLLWFLKLLVTSGLLAPLVGYSCSQEPFIKGFSQILTTAYECTHFLTCILVIKIPLFKKSKEWGSVASPLGNQVISSSVWLPLWLTLADFSVLCGFVSKTLVSSRRLTVIPIPGRSVTPAPCESPNIREQRPGLSVVSPTFQHAFWRSIRLL